MNLNYATFKKINTINQALSVEGGQLSLSRGKID